MKRILIILLTINCSLCAINCSAQLQGQAFIDSLLIELPRQKEDTNKGNVLKQLMASHIATDPEQFRKYSFLYLEFSKKIGWKKGIAGGYSAVGICYQRKGDYPNALDCLFKSLKLYEDLGLKLAISGTLNTIGIVYLEMDDHQNALEYFLKTLKAEQELKHKEGIAGVTCNIGNIYRAQGDYQQAMKYYSTAYKLDVEGGFNDFAATAVGNMGSTCQRLHEYPMALGYFQRAIQIAKEFGYISLIGWNNYSIGDTYLSMIEDTAAKGSNMYVSREQSETGYTSTVSFPKGRTALLAGAIERFQMSLAIAKETYEAGLRRACYEGLSRTYKLKGDYRNAMEYSDSAMIIKDSIFSKENGKRITLLENDRKTFADSIETATAEKAAAVTAATRRNYELIGGAAFLCLLGFTFMLNKKNTLLDKEKKQSDNLLLNILPEEVATELKTTGTTAAKHYNNVTVLFTDFVNFTQAGESMSPQNLIDELHTCFKSFDEITGKYGIEKIKTIGDAYLAVCGLPTADSKHAENVVRAAVEINAFMQDRLAKLGSERTFKVRIGIHSGSVVAGIVGVKKFAYDIWGDTVNTAARMEQNSEAGKINISQTTYELVKDKFTCEYRGEVEAKGKGVMKMYFVN